MDVWLNVSGWLLVFSLVVADLGVGIVAFPSGYICFIYNANCNKTIYIAAYWFLAWGDFHARSRFARPTIPEEKWGTTRSLVLLGNETLVKNHLARTHKKRRFFQNFTLWRA